jgi:aldehyde dehydrogenase (NAD+)
MMATQTELISTATLPYTAFGFQYIGGSWRPGHSGRVEKDIDPYTGETVAEMTLADRSDLDEAYRLAAEAQPEWAAMAPAFRSGIIRRAAAIMESRREEIVTWLIREAGSTRIKARLEWESTHAIMLAAAALPYRVEGKILPDDVPSKESRVYRKPVGVVGVISPWNWPLHLSARSVIPALAVGNTVVLKPASDTPITGGLLLARILLEAELPEKILSVIVGAGSEIGDAFVTHPIPRVISFTGSTPVGRHIAKLASEAPIIKRVELELGGNGPFVVLEDAAIDLAVEAGVFGKFLHQGQICMSVNRFIVVESRYDTFVQRFTDRVKRLKVGNPSEPDTVIGPVINHSQLQKLLERIGHARESGLRQLVGGDPEGLILPPHVFADVSNDHPLARDEIFGPIAPIIRARDEEDALRIANDTEHGLSGAVFTRNLERGAWFARRMEVGMAHVNDAPVIDLPNAPFGGEKNSGIGRFNGDWAVQAFTTDQWVTIQETPRHFPLTARDIGGSWGGG